MAVRKNCQLGSAVSVGSLAASKRAGIAYVSRAQEACASGPVANLMNSQAGSTLLAPRGIESANPPLVEPGSLLYGIGATPQSRVSFLPSAFFTEGRKAFNCDE